MLVEQLKEVHDALGANRDEFDLDLFATLKRHM